jgi:hypothetical protein|tara:strand:- start:1390 stop:1560 length:171 start_codon:yes stop_codon:yes gene_type:complete
MCNQEIAYSQITIDGTREELEDILERSSNNMNGEWEIIDKCIHGTWVSEEICQEKD